MSIDLNPYSCEIPGNLFTGYGGARTAMLAGLRNRRSYAVIGGHRCGKTSLLVQLKQDLEQLKDDHFRIVPLLIDARELKPHSEYEFFSALWSLVTEGLAVEALQPGEAATFDRNFFGMRRIAPLLEEKYGANWLVVFLIDELDRAATTLPDARFYQLLRQMLMSEPHSRHFRLVATGGAGMKPLTGEGSILNLEPIYLGPLSRTEMDELIAYGHKVAPEADLFDLRTDGATYVHHTGDARRALGDAGRRMERGPCAERGTEGNARPVWLVSPMDRRIRRTWMRRIPNADGCRTHAAPR